MGYTYRANKESRRRHDLGRLFKSAVMTFGVMAAMVGYQANSGPSTGITSASVKKTQLVASTSVKNSTIAASTAGANHASAPVVSSGPSGG